MKRTLLLFLLFIFQNKADSQSCNNWLKSSVRSSYVNVGYPIASEDKISIETSNYRKQLYLFGSCEYSDGDIVSKHLVFKNPDYLLSLNHNLYGAQLISNIINDYTSVLSLGVCTNTINVVDASKYNIGDTVLIIQMKGAIIDTTNTAAFGDVINYKNAGNYEFNYIKSKTGNAIELRNKLTRQYDLLNGKVQLIRVPYYTSVTTTSTLTCLPWDGNIGGVLVFNVRDTLILNADIDVSKNGFKGGKGVNTFLNSTNCGQINYYYPNGSVLAALKGENIAVVQQDKAGGRGAPSNGGGGGQDHNSGGGGGSNGALGGFGGYQWQDCPNSPFDNRGWGGKALVYTNAANKVFLGGGAGAGHCNNLGFNSDGGNGGGIVIINTNKIINNGRQIISNGGDALIVSLMAVLAIAMKVWAVVVVVAPY